VGGAGDHNVGMRPDLESIWRVGGFGGPTDAVSDPGGGVGQRSRIPKRLWRPPRTYRPLASCCRNHASRRSGRC
jgi:hypothetical protein